MEPLLYTVRDLPSVPLDAAAHFHSNVLPIVRAELPKVSAVVIVFETADHSHRAWRLAAVQALAREAAPTRVNAIVGTDDGAISEAKDFLAMAPGVTGQLLAVDGKANERG